MTAAIHHFTTECTWSGSTGTGYDAYSRDHTVVVTPAEAALQLSSDRAFQGDPSRLNPEQLLVAAASSCQLLSFLAVAARARLDVVSYRDTAEGVMPGDVRPMRITAITLRPEIHLRDAVDEARVRHLVEVAHRECFIANSLACDVVVEPVIVLDQA